MGDGWHLANLTADLGEQHNRIDDEPAVAQRLRDLHADWRSEVGLLSRLPCSMIRLGMKDTATTSRTDAAAAP